MATTAPDALETRQREVRLSARALARHGLVHAYGHCSARLDADQFLVCAARPMGLIAAGEPGTVVGVRGPLPDGVLGEVRIHQQIYQRRPEVNAVVRSMPPRLMTLGTARRVPRPRHGFGAYFGDDGIALWDDPQLVREDEAAAALAGQLGARAALVMRGNGAVVVGSSLMHAVVLTWYLEDAARLELELLSAGLEAESVTLSSTECARRATCAGLIFERMWDHLTAGDPELASSLP